LGISIPSGGAERLVLSIAHTSRPPVNPLGIAIPSGGAGGLVCCHYARREEAEGEATAREKSGRTGRSDPRKGSHLQASGKPLAKKFARAVPEGWCEQPAPKGGQASFLQVRLS
jgi:hypothetical protein